VVRTALIVTGYLFVFLHMVDLHLLYHHYVAHTMLALMFILYMVLETNKCCHLI